MPTRNDTNIHALPIAAPKTLALVYEFFQRGQQLSLRQESIRVSLRHADNKDTAFRGTHSESIALYNCFGVVYGISLAPTRTAAALLTGQPIRKKRRGKKQKQRKTA